MDYEKTDLDLFPSAESGADHTPEQSVSGAERPSAEPAVEPTVSEPLDMAAELKKKDYFFQIVKWQTVISVILLIAALAVKYSGVTYYKTLHASFQEYYLAGFIGGGHPSGGKAAGTTLPGKAAATSAGASAAGLSAKKTAVTAQAGSGKVPVNAPMLQMAIPVNGTFSSGFGERKDPMDGNPEFHNGIDFAADMGTDVRAALGGTVQNVGYDPAGYGNYIILSHTAGIQTLYGHLSKVAVKTKESVEKGQVIGLVGSAGKSTGPHLHFEIRVNGTPIDPAMLLNLT